MACQYPLVKPDGKIECRLTHEPIRRLKDCHCADEQINQCAALWARMQINQPIGGRYPDACSWNGSWDNAVKAVEGG